MNTLVFGSAAAGKVPETAAGVSAVVMGRESDPMEIAQHLGAAVEKGSAHPASWMLATKKVAPGGRPVSEIDPALLEGAERYKPKDDMFGAPVVTK